MDRYKEQIRKLITEQLGKDVGVFLFGSRARGDSLEFSDYDIGVYAGVEIDENLLRKALQLLKESNLPFNIDIIDFFTVKSEFREIALKDIEIWQFQIAILNLPYSKSFFSPVLM